LKSIFFSGVSVSLLIKFFKNFLVEEVDSDLFGSLKIRLFGDVLLTSSLPPSSRWRNHTTFLSKEEIEDIFNMLQNHFHQSKNPADLIQSLIKENQDMKKTIEEMRKKKLNKKIVN
jgi:hypothetical protein